MPTVSTAAKTDFFILFFAFQKLKVEEGLILVGCRRTDQPLDDQPLDDQPLDAPMLPPTNDVDTAAPGRVFHKADAQ